MIGRRVVTRSALLTVPALLAALAMSAPAATPTLQQLPLQGWITRPDGVAVAAADVTVRIYDAAAGGSPVYDSETWFAGAVTEGRLDLVIGAGVPLWLDDEAEAWLELQIGADEVIGDAAAGRWRFRPGCGSHARPDLAARVAALETALGVAAGAATPTPRSAVPIVVEGSVAAATFGRSHGLLAPGRVSGGAGGVFVAANLLPQPVGVFLTKQHRALLGPHYLLSRDLLATPAPNAVPPRYALHPCRPNPFNPRTTVVFELAATGRARVAVYDLTGARVRELVEADLAAGRQQVVWDGHDDAGRPVPSGTYVLRLTAGGVVRSQKLSLIK